MIKAFVYLLILILAMDYVWLGLIAKRFNTEQLRNIGRISDGKFNVWIAPAALTYFLMAILVVVFVWPIPK